MRSLAVTALSVLLAAGAVRAEDKKKNDPNQIGNRDVGKCLNFYSLEKEIGLGKQLEVEVLRQAKVNEDPIISEYVNRIGQNLVRNSDARVPFTFHVLEDQTPNAFALPGGPVFVNTGLIKIADEEDEFAGAIAHEIAHVAARHMTCHATKSELANLLSIPLGGIVGGLPGVLARQGAGLGMQSMLMKFSRADESEADFLGVQYMYSAGYDPNGAISILEKLEALQRRQPSAAARVFSTHPMDATRIERTQQEIQRILPSKPEYVVSTSEYRDMRTRLIAMDEQRKVGDKDGKPRLRVAPGAVKSGEDERPTIKRRDLVE
jgi:predicted Zn-dependent protease